MAEKNAVQRFQAVKVIAQMLTVAAEKENLNPPISPKLVYVYILYKYFIVFCITRVRNRTLYFYICILRTILNVMSIYIILCCIRLFLC